ncbi:uncharacterized protein LOC122371372 [Amphibalanus amphitrite]|uniref:uncharacterized protein LOC122365838 n=1 Tax=Amphibalanus amphitrite TaxID=1232801 RepID=UPI001C90602C|nr:uncharacterized protein LOC122365838 [Amphibalanus amphitrite]XP_043203584.1 uncharacterized protein LOC122371372 [Amphibalanus amphitrite]
MEHRRRGPRCQARRRGGDLSRRLRGPQEACIGYGGSCGDTATTTSTAGGGSGPGATHLRTELPLIHISADDAQQTERLRRWTASLSVVVLKTASDDHQFRLANLASSDPVQLPDECLPKQPLAAAVRQDGRPPPPMPPLARQDARPLVPPPHAHLRSATVDCG